MLSRFGALVEQASWRSWKTTRAILIPPCTGPLGVSGVSQYVLHAFQKKSKGGIKTPKTEIELIKSRLKRAEDEPAEWLDARNK